MANVLLVCADQSDNANPPRYRQGYRAMKLFASLDDFLKPSDGLPQLGRSTANHRFLLALLRYGTFDAYHFFLSNSAHQRLFIDSWAPAFESIGIKDKVEVFTRLELPSLLGSYDYTVFHQSDHISFFNALCRFRNRIGASFPVTAFIHSISYREYMSTYLEMSLVGATSSDALICSSACGRQVIDRCFERLSGAMPNAAKQVRSIVVPLGIDEQERHPERHEARARQRLKQDEVIALCFGRFSEVDKMDLFPLLQAFLHTGCRNQPWRLVLAGAVHAESYFRMVTLWTAALGLQERVTIFANPDEAVKNDLYHAADFFISPADNPQETFGLTLLEAMWAGLPLVVSDFDGYKELVTPEVGFRIPTYWDRFDPLDALQPLMDERTFHLFAAQSLCIDIPSLTEKLTRLFSDQTLRTTLSKASRQRFDAHYTHRSIIRRLEAVWDRLKSDFVSKTAKTDPLSLETFNTFSHYATRALGDDDRVQVTQLGKEVRDKQSTYPLIGQMSDIIDQARVREMMREAATPVRIGDLMRAGQGDAWRRRYQILWMLKHGLLEMAP